MRIADAQVAMEEFPSQAYDFNDAGIRTFVTQHGEPRQLDTMATMLNSKPLDLIKPVFRSSSALLAALKLPLSTILAKVKELAGGVVAAAIDKVINVLTGLYNWLSKM